MGVVPKEVARNLCVSVFLISVELEKAKESLNSAAIPYVYDGTSSAEASNETNKADENEGSSCDDDDFTPSILLRVPKDLTVVIINYIVFYTNRENWKNNLNWWNPENSGGDLLSHQGVSDIFAKNQYFRTT